MAALKSFWDAENPDPIYENMPPSRVRDWLDWGVWDDLSDDELGFWDVMQDSVTTFLKTGERGIEPFKIYSHRYCHELAHFIVCQDDQVMDPWWGLEVWTFREDGLEWFDDNAAFVEIEVLVVQELIKGCSNETAASWAQGQIGPNSKLSGYGRFDTLNEHGKKEVYDLVYEYGLMFARKWTRLSMWRERNRKTDLVRRLRGLPPEPREGRPAGS